MAGGLVGRALRARRADGSESRPYPPPSGRFGEPSLPIASLVNVPTGQLINSCAGPSGPHHAPRINQLLPFELFKGEAGEGTVIDEEDDNAGTGECVSERNEFRPALQRFR